MEVQAPVFYPTMEEFQDFAKYVSSIQSEVKVGICKVVPPAEWKAQFKYEHSGETVIPSPIKQYVEGDRGVYQLTLIEGKPVTAKDFQEMAEQQKMTKSAKYDYDSIERTFWRNVRFNPPTYGADMSGSFMDESVTAWNCNKLNCILQVLGTNLPGITSPYLYFGMWKAMFAWHVEDMNLFSINYLHFGEPKSWWAIPPTHGHRLETLAHGLFPEQYQTCHEFLRHKTTLISPQILMRNSIPITRAIQSEGEFIITFPYSYHCGFNHGYNCAESVNFALESWIEWGRKANCCNCRDDIVKIDMDIFAERYKYWLENGSIPPLEELPEPIPIPKRNMTGNSHKKRAPQESANASQSLVQIGHEGEREEEVLGNKRKSIKPKWLIEEGDEPSEQEVVQSPKKPRRVAKRLTTAEENVLQEAMIKAQGVPAAAVRQKLAVEINWTNEGIYNWCKRKWSKIEADKEGSRLQQEQGNANKVDVSPASIPPEITLADPVKELKRPRPPRGTTPKKPKKYSLVETYQGLSQSMRVPPNPKLMPWLTSPTIARPFPFNPNFAMMNAQPFGKTGPLQIQPPNFGYQTPTVQPPPNYKSNQPNATWLL